MSNIEQTSALFMCYFDFDAFTDTTDGDTNDGRLDITEVEEKPLNWTLLQDLDLH